MDVDVGFVGLAVCSIILATRIIKKRRDRRFYARAENLDRHINGFYKTCFLTIKQNPEEFFKHTRMIIPVYDLLFNMVKGRLVKKRTKYTICEEARFALTLSYLSQGVSTPFLGWSFKMGHSTVWNIIYETTDIIWNVLSPLYCKIPDEAMFDSLATQFGRKWQLPNCLGALDGRHMSIIAPPHSGSQFYNYKNFYSIVLLAASDADYKFTMVDVGAYGSQSDGGILAESLFGKQLYKNELPLPVNKILPNSDICFPNFFIGDPAFPLRSNIMRPYSGKHLPLAEKNFNYRISRARVVIENAFGILVSRWAILQTTLKCIPTNAERIILACVALHNFLLSEQTLNDSKYCPPSYTDSEDNLGRIIPGQWRSEVQDDTAGLQHMNRQVGSNNSARHSIQLRNILKDYFQNEGAIPQQLKIK